MMSIKAHGIEIARDKLGRERAYYWSMRRLRRFPLPIHEAKQLIAAGFARRVKFQ